MYTVVLIRQNTAFHVIVCFSNVTAALLSGVTVNRKSGEMNVYAKMIISAAGVRNTFKFLLPKDTVCNLRKYIRLNPLNAMKKCI